MSPSNIRIEGKKYPITALRKCSRRDLRLDKDFFLFLSALKLGDVHAVEKCAREMAKAISSTLPKDFRKNRKDYIIINHPATTQTSVAVSLVNSIARILQMQKGEIVLENIYFGNTSYYDLSPTAKRKILEKKLHYYGPRVRNKRIILIDDISATGSALKMSSKLLLGKKPKSLSLFVYLKLENNIEKEITAYQYKQKGIKYLVQLMNNKDNIITSRLLSLILSLSPSETALLLGKVSRERRKRLIRELTDYTKLYSKVYWTHGFSESALIKK
ncbi:MAG: phosphoribosyltransferase [Candidatus Pacebacteria bacterium]|nr:phosphoribosyltransferase [Candidatus Paceibacterota bacterium]